MAVSVGLLACPAPASDRRIVLSPAETLTVQRTGNGPTVVLLPGLLGGAFTYRKVTASLAAVGRSAIVVEPLGYGESSRPYDADYSFETQAERVNAALDSLGVREAVVVAHALGGSIALWLAIRHPDRVRAIVLLNASPAERLSTPGIGNALRIAPIIQLFGATRIVRHRVSSALKAHSSDTAWVTDSVVAAYARPITSNFTATLRVLKRMSSEPVGDSLAPRLPRVAAPVLLLVPREERRGGLEPSEIARYAAGLSNFTTDSVDRSGEFLQEERPDAVVAAVLRAESGAVAAAPAPFVPECATADAARER